jgi:uncharacterized protein YggT (Ycf19 family)
LAWWIHHKELFCKEIIFEKGSMRTVLLIASWLVTAYTFLIIFRILAEWFVGAGQGRVWGVLKAVTAPPLAAFRWMKFLRRGEVDFTPLPAIISLQLISFLFQYLAAARIISAASVVAAVLLALWRILFSLLLFFLLLTAVRLAGLFFAKQPSSAFFRMVDVIISPLARAGARLLPARRSITYRTALLVIFIVLALVAATGILFVEPSLILMNLRTGVDLLY